MTSISAIFDQALRSVALALRPVHAQWSALDAGPRRLVLIGAALLAAGFLLAFVWLPAVRTRDTLAVRLPQLEMLLADMRNQAKEAKALANAPTTPVAMHIVADVAALQSIFGTDAKVTVAEGGFRIVIPAIAYADWWDKTGDVLSRHALMLHTASLSRLEGPGLPAVAVDMLLNDETRAAGSSSTPPTPSTQSQ